jgi:hypothetical protein
MPRLETRASGERIVLESQALNGDRVKNGKVKRMEGIFFNANIAMKKLGRIQFGSATLMIFRALTSERPNKRNTISTIAFSTE